MTTTETRVVGAQAGPTPEDLAKQMGKVADLDAARALWREVRQEVGRKEQADTRWKHAIARLPEMFPRRFGKIIALVNEAREKEIAAARGGRPKVDPTAQGRSRQDKVVYAPGQHPLIRQLAGELGVSEAQIVRELMEEALVARGLRTGKNLTDTRNLRNV